MRRRDLLIHPAFTGALALLALNDHVLKAAAPGFITGKLSDVAGLFVTAVLLFILTNRPRLSVAFSGAAFAAIKLSVTAAIWATPVLGGLTRQDPTDLFALVVLWPAYVFVSRVESGGTAPAISGSWVVAASALATLLTLTATSCQADPGVAAFSVSGDRIFARIVNDAAEQWAVSKDGGVTWAPTSPPAVQTSPSRTACTPEALCYRVIPDQRVEVSQQGGDWASSFAFTAEERRRMDLRDPDCIREPALFDAVTAVELDGDSHVIVAMSTQGVLHRDPNGTWERVPVLDLEPVSLFGPSWLSRSPLMALLLILVSPIFILVGRLRARRNGGIPAFLVALFGGLALLTISGILVFFQVDYVILGPVIVILSLLVFIASLVIARGKPERAEPLPPPWSGVS